MTARRATVDDLRHLLEMAQVEHAGSRFAHIPFDYVHAEKSFRHFIDGLSSVVFVSDGGFIGGMVQPMVFSRLWNAYELAWFAQDGSGMELLNAFTKWAHQMRAINVVVHGYSGMVPPARMDRVMARRGFENQGSSYSKQLGVH